MPLRPYQAQLYDDIKAAFLQGYRHVCAVLPCGGGKSVIIAAIAKAATDKGNRVLFLVHRKELCDQILGHMKRQGVDPSFCSVMTVQTASRRLRNLETPALIIIDEAHHSLSASYGRIFLAFPAACVVGFTATPQRMGEGGLGAVFEKLILSVTASWLINNKYLTPYRYYSVQLADASKVHTRHGDFVKDEVARLMEKSYIFGDTVNTWKEKAAGCKTIIYCATIEASKRTVEAFRAAGIAAAHLDGTTPQGVRERTVQAFKAGRLMVLSNVDLFGEGFDVPDCEAVLLLRPTQSLTLHIQQSMRSMRVDPHKPDKVAVIIDHVGNYIRHGLPDQDREWTLKARKKKDGGLISVKECPLCHMVMQAPADACPYCGYIFEKEERKENGMKSDVALEEIKEKPYEEYKQCQTFDELVAFQKAKKYKFAWAIHKALELGIEVPKKYKFMMIHMRRKKA